MKVKVSICGRASDMVVLLLCGLDNGETTILLRMMTKKEDMST